MSSASSDSEISYDSEDSEIHYIAEVETEENEDSRVTTSQALSDEEDQADLYADDPLADAEWSEEYQKEVDADKELERTLKDRLKGKVELNQWCTCGNCHVASLQNISECYCCHELEGCQESMESDLVLKDLGPDVTLKCVTEHPGFKAVCLQKWSLRLASGKYKTKGKQTYRQTGSENDFLRSVSYREFTRLVYGMLGKKRIPLPACAYVAIEKNFQLKREKAMQDLTFMWNLKKTKACLTLTLFLLTNCNTNFPTIAKIWNFLENISFQSYLANPADS